MTKQALDVPIKPQSLSMIEVSNPSEAQELELKILQTLYCYS